MDKSKESLAWIAALFADPTKKIVFHNAKFDLKMFWHEGIDVLGAKGQIHCTLVLAKMFHGQLDSYELLQLGIRFFGRNPKDKTEITDWLKAHKLKSFKEAPREMVKRRALWDVETTLMLFTFLYPRVQKICPELYETERNLILCVVDMETTGVLVDITRTKELKAIAEKGIIQLQQELDKLVCPLKLRYARCTNKKCKRKKKICDVLFDKDVPACCPLCHSPVIVETAEIDTFKVGSSAIQMPAAFIQMGIDLRYKTKPKKGKKGKPPSGGGRWAFDEYAMIRYVSPQLAKVLRESGDEAWPFDKFNKAVHDCCNQYNLPKKELLPPLIMKLRELQKMVNTYYDHFIEKSVNQHYDQNGRLIGTIHGSFNQSEADTGRFSSSNPNLQNMPRILGPRECFIPRPRRRNWHFDYEQVEMKFFVHFAEDPTMAKAIESDIHLHVAAAVYNLPIEKVSKEQRKRGKGINFGIIYGARPPKISETLTQKGIPTTVAESTTLCSAYHRRFPSVQRRMHQYKVELARQGYLTNPFGRRYYISNSKAYTGLNYMCQGTSADLMKSAMVKIWRYIRDNGLRSKILIQVHDELVIEMPRNEERRLAPKIVELMEDRTSYYIPITVDAEVVDARWSEKKKPEKLGIDIHSDCHVS